MFAFDFSRVGNNSNHNSDDSPSILEAGWRVDTNRAVDMPYRRELRFSPRRTVRNVLSTVNAREAVGLQAIAWGER